MFCLKNFKNYFTKLELSLWLCSVLIITISFFIFSNDSYLTLIASIIGVTSLIFSAKANPIGMVLMIIFSVLYGIISYSFNYFGEMITYIGMTLPMSVVSLVSWLRNPFKGQKSEVKINRINLKDVIIIFSSSALVTIIFYLILKYFNTANLIPSTVSVTTSYIAAFLTFKRSPYFALAYAFNDVVLIILWLLASLKDISYISVFVCFLAFLVNDLYGFINWGKLSKKQNKLTNQ